jgi:filamentous hemagglutinin family protein
MQSLSIFLNLIVMNMVMINFSSYSRAFGLLTALSMAALPAEAQIIPDRTLGAESSRLENLTQITGGAQRGGNLFHSFSQFNIGEGDRVDFAAPVGVQNILTRVTGGPSNLLGTLGVGGTANLFLINPSGIFFGPNANLNMGGSFIATTADAVRLGNAGLFSASQPQSSVLLSIQPDALPFNQINPQAAITNLSRAGLVLANGNSAALVGGNINFDRGILAAPSGTIEIGGLAAPGTIGLNLNGNDLSLSFPEGVLKANVSLLNRSSVNSFPQGGRNIRVNANQIDIQDSQVISFIDQGLGSSLDKRQAANIIFNAANVVNISKASLVGTFVQSGAIGNSGRIEINAKTLNLRDGSFLDTTHSGQGNSGDILINATDRINLLDNSKISTSRFDGIGRTGNIQINTTALNITNGGLVETSLVAGQGTLGNITIDAKDTIVIAGERSLVSAYSGQQATKLTQDSGNIQITTGNLLINQGGGVSTLSEGAGAAGNIQITARETVRVADVSPESPKVASLITTSGLGANANSGDIQIKAAALEVLAGGGIVAESQGGNGGNILIDTTDRVLIQGQPRAGADRSRISSAIQTTDPQKRGGDIRITTGSLIMDQGHQIGAAAFGTGRAGDIVITARDRISLDGADRTGSATVIATGLGRRVDGRDLNSGAGAAGAIRITANSLVLTNGAVINAITNIPGSAGDIDIQTRSAISLSGRGPLNNASRISAEVTESGNGQGGNLKLITGNLSLDNGGNIAASNSAQGSAGSLTVFADRLRLDNGASIQTESTSGQGGNLQINSNDYLLLRRGSFISTTAGLSQGSGDGGNLVINTPLLVAVASENSDITANAFKGSGGRISIKTSGLFGITPAVQQTNQSNITASSREGIQGTIDITPPDVRPEQGLNNLPSNILDASNQLGQSCPRGTLDRPQSSFVISGRGSLPPSPLEALTGDAGLPGLARLAVGEVADRAVSNVNLSSVLPTLVEAQGWRRSADGKVILVATVAAGLPLGQVAGCPRL